MEKFVYMILLGRNMNVIVIQIMNIYITIKINNSQTHIVLHNKNAQKKIIMYNLLMIIIQHANNNVHLILEIKILIMIIYVNSSVKMKVYRIITKLLIIVLVVVKRQDINYIIRMYVNKNVKIPFLYQINLLNGLNVVLKNGV